MATAPGSIEKGMLGSVTRANPDALGTALLVAAMLRAWPSKSEGAVYSPVLSMVPKLDGTLHMTVWSACPDSLAVKNWGLPRYTVAVAGVPPTVADGAGGGN